MALIRASCENCGDVELRSHNSRADDRGTKMRIGQIYLNEVTTREEVSFHQYVFKCPACRQVMTRVADENVSSVLIAAGVIVRRISAAKAQPTGIRPDAEPFGDDDSIDLHSFLFDDPAALYEELKALSDVQP